MVSPTCLVLFYPYFLTLNHSAKILIIGFLPPHSWWIRAGFWLATPADFRSAFLGGSIWSPVYPPTKSPTLASFGISFQGFWHAGVISCRWPVLRSVLGPCSAWALHSHFNPYWETKKKCRTNLCKTPSVFSLLYQLFFLSWSTFFLRGILQELFSTFFLNLLIDFPSHSLQLSELLNFPPVRNRLILPDYVKLQLCSTQNTHTHTHTHRFASPFYSVLPSESYEISSQQLKPPTLIFT